VYAFAIVLWQILTLKEPFKYYQELAAKQNREIAIKMFGEAVVSGERPQIPDRFPKDYPAKDYPEVGELLTAAWSADPAKRPSFPQLIEMIDNLLISVAVRDEKARNFWRTHFITKVNSVMIHWFTDWNSAKRS
jgi:hypothetical protein